MKLLIVALVLGLALYWWWRRNTDGYAGSVFEKDDPRLLDAKRDARASLPQFWAALDGGDPADSEFALKFNLNHGSGLDDNESIWACDVVRRQGRIFGNLGNEPVNPAYREGQEVEITPEAIDDWSYFHDGVAQGHFVTRLMLESAAPGVAKHQKQALGWE